MVPSHSLLNPNHTRPVPLTRLYTPQGRVQGYQNPNYPVPHAFFTRQGGHSVFPFQTLNLGFRLGDRDINVRKNRLIVKSQLGIHWLRNGEQVHGKRLVEVTPETHEHQLKKTDGLLTKIPGIGLLILQADCQAVLLYDPATPAIGAAHVGWQGSTQNITGLLVKKMQQRFGSDSTQIYGMVSPALGPCCAEFIDFANTLPPFIHPFHVGENRIDFWALSRHQLQQAGLLPQHISIAGLCTRCHRDFFSYRRSKLNRLTQGQTGRQGSVIMLPNPIFLKRAQTPHALPS